MSARARVAAALAVATAAASLIAMPLGAQPGAAAPPTFAAASDAALATLLHVYYRGAGSWAMCDRAGCPAAANDWGADDLTYVLWLRWQVSHDSSIPPLAAALAKALPDYAGACDLPGCASWSDVPEWDTIAAIRDYEVSGDPQALARAEAAFGSVQNGNAFSLGACPEIRYQQPSGGSNLLKTLETDGNATKSAILLYQVTGKRSYLSDAERTYRAIRAHFLDPAAPLYTVYVFDDGTACTQLPHRFFASVNGDLIWSGFELARLTGKRQYRAQSLATARAVAGDLNDAAGIFTDLQAENDVAEPLVEAMLLLAQAHEGFARDWILTNAKAALSARTPDGSVGRFWDGPPPRAAVTAWQTAGGLALEIAAGALDPSGSAQPVPAWAGAQRVERSLGPTGTIHFTGAGIAILGTLGEKCCEAGHARVLIDGRETFDRTGIWQNKSSSGESLPGSILFAWRWPRPGPHTIQFEPGVPNAKEGGSFLHVRAYLVLH